MTARVSMLNSRASLTCFRLVSFLVGLRTYQHPVQRNHFVMYLGGRHTTDIHKTQLLVLHNLKLVWRPNLIKYFQASSRVTWSSGEWTSVSRTICSRHPGTDSLTTGTKWSLKRLVHSLFNHMTWLLAREYFIELLMSFQRSTSCPFRPKPDLVYHSTMKATSREADNHSATEDLSWLLWRLQVHNMFRKSIY